MRIGKRKGGGISRDEGMASPVAPDDYGDLDGVGDCGVSDSELVAG